MNQAENYCRTIKRMCNRGDGIVLPAEYQRVEWIENGGTGRCYIGINQPVYNTYHYMLTFEIVNDIGGSIIGGNDVSGEPYPLATVHLYYPNTGLGYVVNKGYQWMTTFSSGIRYTLEFWKDNNSFFANLNGQPITTSRIADNSNNSRLVLFYSTWGGYCTPCKLYDVTIKDSYNGANLYKLVPCYRKSDNTPGMYNVVTDTFYAGSVSGANPGTYILGNNV